MKLTFWHIERRARAGARWKPDPHSDAEDVCYCETQAECEEICDRQAKYHRHKRANYRAAPIEIEIGHHAPEPWRWVPDRGGPSLVAADNSLVCDFGWDNGVESLSGNPPLLASRTRITACVNALEGVPTEWLPGVKALLRAVLSSPVRVTGESPMAEMLEAWINSNKVPQASSLGITEEWEEQFDSTQTSVRNKPRSGKTAVCEWNDN